MCCARSVGAPGLRCDGVGCRESREGTPGVCVSSARGFLVGFCLLFLLGCLLFFLPLCGLFLLHCRSPPCTRTRVVCHHNARVCEYVHAHVCAPACVRVRVHARACACAAWVTHAACAAGACGPNTGAQRATHMGHGLGVAPRPRPDRGSGWPPLAHSMCVPCECVSCGSCERLRGVNV